MGSNRGYTYILPIYTPVLRKLECVFHLYRKILIKKSDLSNGDEGNDKIIGNKAFMNYLFELIEKINYTYIY